VNRFHPNTWWFSKRTWPKSGDPQAQANTLAGFHEDNVLLVLDESGGIPASVMATAEGALANADMSDPNQFAKIFQAGNPTHLEGPLYDACNTHRHLWTVVEISSDPDDPDRTPRVSKQWAQQQIDMYGRDNPWVLVNVFGRFPPASINTLLGPDEVRDAMNRGLKEEDFSWAQKRIGVDVARFGDDRTVLFPRQGLWAGEPVVMRNARTTAIAARVMMAKRKWGSEVEFVDDTGHWGHGVIDNLIVAGVSAVPVIFSDPALDPAYYNRRAEMWLNMAEWVKNGGALPDIPELVAELATPTYTFRGGKIILEDKDQIKSRLGRSPDLADALALTFALPDMPGKMGYSGEVAMVMSQQAGKTIHDYNPLERG
jgi:phage terminase large subunit